MTGLLSTTAKGADVALGPHECRVAGFQIAFELVSTLSFCFHVVSQFFPTELIAVNIAATQ